MTKRIAPIASCSLGHQGSVSDKMLNMFVHSLRRNSHLLSGESNNIFGMLSHILKDELPNGLASFSHAAHRITSQELPTLSVVIINLMKRFVNLIRRGRERSHERA